MKIHALLFISFLFLSSSFCYANGDSNNQEETKKKNKFREREASDDMLGYPNLDEDSLLNSKCPRHLELRWQTEVSSSIYATPLIADINSDGKLEVVVPSFVHYLEVLEGTDGDKVPGWPVFHQSSAHSSPLLYDIDKDGTREIALATYNGVINFFRVSGYMMVDKLEVPRRKVRKDWYVGLYPDHADRSHPDVHDSSIVQEATDMHSPSLKDDKGNKTAGTTGALVNASSTPTGTNESAKISSTPVSVTMNSSNTSTSTLGATDSVNTSSTSATLSATDPSANTSSKPATLGATDSLNSLTNSTLNGNISSIDLSKTEKRSENQSSEAAQEKRLPHTSLENSTSVDLSSKIENSENASQSQRRLLQETEKKESQEGNSNTHANSEVASAENKESLEDEADASFDLFKDAEDLDDEYSYDYDDYVDDSLWGDEEWSEEKHKILHDYVDVDSHILCTPVIADIDNDGVQEMIVAVSYFFDREYYETAEHMADLGDIDREKYVASGIVVFNLDTKQVKWTADLDLSIDSGTFRAYIYSSPTVVDLDGDGNLDILVGTYFGLVYVLDHRGKVRERFPLEMAEIQGPVVAGDINDDGKIEIVTTDSHGNVAAWTPEGDELWEVHLKSLIPQGPTIGDVDGDGYTDVVVPTVSGNIYVLSGKDGSFVRPFPYRTHGRVMNPVLLLDLSKHDEKSKGLTLVTSAFDGYLYLIDGSTACTDVVDIGETSYSMVLADNVDGGDDLDLIVTTMNGNVFCFSTPSPHHPMKEWKSWNQGRNNVASRYNREGIYISHGSRAFRDEEGKHFWMEMEVIDSRGLQGPYNVTTTLLVPGNYQGERRIVVNNVYNEPGKQRLKLPTVPVRTTGTVLVEMVDKNGIYFSDEFSLTFHMHFYKLLKWLLVLPMLGMFGVLVLLRPQEGTPLPSFSRNID